MSSPLMSGFMKTGNKNPRNVGLASSRPDERWTHPATDGLLIKLYRPQLLHAFADLKVAAKKIKKAQQEIPGVRRDRVKVRSLPGLGLARMTQRRLPLLFLRGKPILRDQLKVPAPFLC